MKGFFCKIALYIYGNQIGTMKKILNAIALFCLPICADIYAQQYKSMTIQPAGVVVASEIPANPWMGAVVSVEAPDFFSRPDRAYLRSQKKLAGNWYRQEGAVHAGARVQATLPPPTILAGMNGNGFNSSVPLDNYLAVNNDEQIVSVANTTFRVYDGQNMQGTLSSTLALFTQPLGLTGPFDSKYDPKVIYDPEADRYIAVILNGFEHTTSRVVLAFSQSSDAMGHWNLYTLSGSPFGDSTWFDFPSIAITKDELFVTGNQVFSGVSWQAGFSQSVIWQVSKAEGYAGQPLQTRLWSDIKYGGRAIRNLHPVKAAYELGGPKQYFLSNRNFALQNDTIFLLKITGLQNDPNCSLEVEVLRADVPYGLAPDARQPGIPDSLATNDARVLGAIWYENEIHFASNSAVPVSGNAGIYFGVIQGFNTPSPEVNGYIIGFDTLDLGYPNVVFMGRRPDGKMRSLIAFNHSGPQTYPGYSMIYHENGEFSDVVRVVSGTHIIDVLEGNYERWGDYFGAQPFYPIHGQAWLAGTFGSTNKRHRTWLAKVESPMGTSPAGLELESKGKGLVYPNPVEDERMFVRFEAPQAGEIRAEILDLQGRVVGRVFEGYIKKGMNELGFAQGPLPAGTYILRLSGAVQFQTQFVRSK